MDDTVILSTTRQGAIRKLEMLSSFCNSHGMRVNCSKTKFMVINSKEHDNSDLVAGNLIVKMCDHYIYLGSPFTADGLVSSAIKIHANSKMCQALKYVSFCNKNNDVPFYIKKKIFDADLMSRLLYGC